MALQSGQHGGWPSGIARTRQGVCYVASQGWGRKKEDFAQLIISPRAGLGVAWHWVREGTPGAFALQAAK